MAPISERQRAGFNIYKKPKKMRYIYIYIQKAGHFSKRQTICVMFLIYKKTDTLRYVICNESFEIGIHIYI